MKTIRKTTIVLMAIFAFALNKVNAVDGNENLNIDPDKSEITWLGEKVTGQHTGTINIREGNLELNNGSLVGGSFTIDMTSLVSTDLDGEYKGKLEGHLKSDDFFGVNKFPSASLVIKKATKKGNSGTYLVKADITIKGITKAIEFTVQLVDNGGSYSANATIIIDRSEFDIRYGSGSFFDDLGDKTIYDEFTLNVRLQTK
jgi:polyisoprenoid-binding protein YceI